MQRISSIENTLCDRLKQIRLDSMDEHKMMHAAAVIDVKTQWYEICRKGAEQRLLWGEHYQI